MEHRPEAREEPGPLEAHDLGPHEPTLRRLHVAEKLRRFPT
jgi:hypothetical protein